MPDVVLRDLTVAMTQNTTNIATNDTVNAHRPPVSPETMSVVEFAMRVRMNIYYTMHLSRTFWNAPNFLVLERSGTFRMITSREPFTFNFYHEVSRHWM